MLLEPGADDLAAGLDVSIAPDGEILVEGPTVAGGGVLRTGDLGRLDERGRLIVHGTTVSTNALIERTGGTVGFSNNDYGGAEARVSWPRGAF